jgi:topoisomerase-4 subunit B
VLNTWEVERDRLFANNEIHDIAVAIGVDPHGPNDTPDLLRAALRQGLHPVGRRRRRLAHPGAAADAVLPHFPQLIARGHVYVAKPPLFRIDAPARGKQAGAKIYALDEGELEATLDKLRKEGARDSWKISRFKGLGEMNAEQLWDTTLNPETRRLSPVALGELDYDATVARMTMLMGKGEAASRRSWLEEKGNEVEADI